jgi:adenosylmethionine-8-amino-7-oxononanoate aminotransferase
MSIKFARTWALATGRSSKTKVLARNPSYHGNTFGALAVSGESYVDPVYGDMLRLMPKIPVPSAYRPPAGMNGDEHARVCAEALDIEIRRQGPDTVLAFIMEPVTGLSGGASSAPDFYYRRIREICNEHDVLLIFDEVMSGSGRTGRFLAAHHWPDARPDIVALAKGLGAGYFPLGALVAGTKLVDAVADAGGFRMGHTGMSSPLSCAVAAAVIGVVVEENLMDNAERMGEYYRGRLGEVRDGSRILGDVRGMGLLNAVEMVADPSTRAPLPPEAEVNGRICRAALERGLLIYARATAGGSFGDWLMMTPPLNVTAAQIDEIVEVFTESLAAVESDLVRDGFLP